METLRNLRKKLNKTQAFMAKQLGITQQAYAAYENKVTTPPSDILQKLADYFNVTTDYLLGRVNEINTDSFDNSKESVEKLFNAYGITRDKVNSLPDTKKQLIMSLIKEMIKDDNK